MASTKSTEIAFDRPLRVDGPGGVQERLGLSRAKIFAMLKSGELPNHMFGRTRVVMQSDFERFLHQHRVTSQEK